MAQRMLDEKSRVSEPQDDDVSDAETLGSRDTNDLSDVSEEEEEEELFDQKENVPPPRRERRKIPQLQDESSTEPNTAKKAKRVPKRRGKYQSWARHRVSICQALRDAVFDRKKAGEILKRGHRLFVPATVIGYYARKLSPSPFAPLSSQSAPLLPPKKHRR
ncbi:22K [turkey adenovirus 5]|uniref:22K n=1 Tax=turkey adenovirus 5 TaxID=1408258 RepID=U5NHZ5_9ADEN|nr:22K [Turkey aviadenovirus 5]AGX93345.1 22K [Turkey aviadenovirus 5]AGX93382.1 22K [Turkey aviadenovirus 5]